MEYNGFVIKSDGVYSYYRVHGIKGGAVPKVLSGLYTSIREAKKAIDSYIRSQIPQRPKLKTKPVSAKRKAKLDEEKLNGSTKGSAGGK